METSLFHLNYNRQEPFSSSFLNSRAVIKKVSTPAVDDSRDRIHQDFIYTLNCTGLVLIIIQVMHLKERYCRSVSILRLIEKILFHAFFAFECVGANGLKT